MDISHFYFDRKYDSLRAEVLEECVSLLRVHRGLIFFYRVSFLTVLPISRSYFVLFIFSSPLIFNSSAIQFGFSSRLISSALKNKPAGIQFWFVFCFLLLMLQRARSRELISNVSALLWPIGNKCWPHDHSAIIIF